jgi:predicted lipoprotein with Yx(FWY)xxD motif
MRFRGAFSLITSLALGAVVLAACGSSSSNASSTGTTATTAGGSGATSGATVSLSSTALGPTLVDAQGRTLYVFKSDTPGKSNCNAGCDGTWPPLVAPATITVGAGLNQADFTTITRADGTKQVADLGLPLYTFSGDAKPGDTAGDGLGNLWYAVGTSAKPATGSKLASLTSPGTEAPAPATTDTTSGYNY